MIHNADRAAFIRRIIQESDTHTSIPVFNKKTVDEDGNILDADLSFADIITVGYDSVFDASGILIPEGPKASIFDPNQRLVSSNPTKNREQGIHLYHSSFNTITDSELAPLPCVSLLQASGSGKMITNAARVSFYGATHEKATFGDFTNNDRKLIRKLLMENHGSCLEHSFMTFRLFVPNPIFKQFLRHRIGFSFNEISTRYAEILDRLYIPARLLKQSESNKQGSAFELIDNHNDARELYIDYMKEAYSNYTMMLRMGVSREQARNLLPTGFYTEAYVSTNLRALFHFLNLRLDHHAQYEIRQYALMMAIAAMNIYPEVFRIILEDKEVGAKMFQDQDVPHQLMLSVASTDPDYRQSLPNFSLSNIASDEATFIDQKDNENRLNLVNGHSRATFNIRTR